MVPVLIHGSWPELKNVVIRGVGRSVQDHYVHTMTKDDLGRTAKSKHRLQHALEPNLWLTIEQEATKSFHHMKNLPLNVATGS